MDGQNELLIIFNQLIKKHGGRHKLINSIECEWMKSIPGYSPYKWTKDNIEYIVNGYHKLSVQRMSQVLNISHRIVDNKIRQLREETDLLGKQRKTHIHNDHD